MHKFYRSLQGHTFTILRRQESVVLVDNVRGNRRMSQLLAIPILLTNLLAPFLELKVLNKRVTCIDSCATAE